MQQSVLLQYGIYHKNWIGNTIIEVETIILLELIEVIERKGRHITRGKLLIGFDNHIAYRDIVKKVLKPNSHAKDAGAEIAQIRNLISKISFEIEIKLIKGHQKISSLFQNIPLQHLLKECNEEARALRENIED